MTNNQNFLEFLVKKGVMDIDQSTIVEIESKKKNISFEKCIVDFNFFSKNTLSKLLMEFKNSNNSIYDFIIDIDLIKMIPYSFCISKKCLPISINNSCLYIGMIKKDINIIQEIEKFLKFDYVNIVLCEEGEIHELIQKNYTTISNWIEFIENKEENTTELFIDRLLFDAVNKGASDIHFSADENIVRVRYRIDGELKKICIFHRDYYGKILVRLKIMFSVDITTSVKSRDGSLNKIIFGNKVDFRISFHSCIYAENVVIRILNNLDLLSLDSIGYSDKVLENIRKMLDKPGGLIIFIGPTGSGKTTSLYASLKEIDPHKHNVMTVEDPVECYLRFIQQTDINNHPDMSFSSCLRSILRQDPDVILIGEIRDAETAAIALRASMTGHKVFTTLHAKDIFSVIDRFREFGLSENLCLNNITGIVSQRLVKKICIKCKSLGCEYCMYSGYRGRCVMAESVFFDDRIIEIFMSKESNDLKHKSISFEYNYSSMLKGPKEDSMVSIGVKT